MGTELVNGPTKAERHASDIQNAASDMHKMSQVGEKANVSMIEEVGLLNQKYAKDPASLKAIEKQYKSQSKDDPLFINEVQIGKDGSLEFRAEKATSPALEKIQTQLLQDMRQQSQDGKRGDIVGLIGDSKALDTDVKALQKEEQAVVAAIKGPSQPAKN